MYPMKDADVASCSVSVAPQEQNSKGFKNAFEREHFSFLFFFAEGQPLSQSFCWKNIKLENSPELLVQ